MLRALSVRPCSPRRSSPSPAWPRWTSLVNGPPAAEAAASPAQEMLTLVNAERSKAGCAPVRLDARLNNAAAKHSTDMAANNYFSHTSRNGACS